MEIEKKEDLWLAVTFGEVENGVIIINQDILLLIFEFLDIFNLHSLTAVCTSWRSVIQRTDHLVWRAKCLTLPKNDLQLRPDNFTWYQWFAFVQSYKFLPTVLTTQLEYLNDDFSVRKLSSRPDTSVALVSRVFSQGTAFCEFSLDVFGDELLIGVTNDAEFCITNNGYVILDSKKVWGYWSRRGIQCGATRHRTASFEQGAKIGVYVDVKEGVVSIFKDRYHVYTSGADELERLCDIGKGFQFFAMLDYENDVVSLSQCFLGESTILNMKETQLVPSSPVICGTTLD